MTSNDFGKDGWTLENLNSLEGKTYLITGTTSGTGFEATRILLSKGATVVMLNRNLEKSQNTIDSLKQEFGTTTKVSHIILDLASLTSVREACRKILKEVSKIDALICNGAIAQIATQEITEDGFESQMGVNYYANFLLCNLLFDKIDESKGRIVMVASEGYKMGIKTIQFDDMNWDKNYHPNKVYSQSKLALMMFAYKLQDKITAAGKDVKVYVCHPGASNTSLINEKANIVTRLSWSLMVKIGLAQTAKKGSYPEVMCATEEDLEQKSYYGPTGKMYFSGPVGECKLALHALDDATMEKLWEVSEKAVETKWDI